MRNDTTEGVWCKRSGDEAVLSLSEFRKQYMTRVLNLVDRDLNQAVSALGVAEHDVQIIMERV